MVHLLRTRLCTLRYWRILCQQVSARFSKQEKQKECLGLRAYNRGFVSISPIKWQYFHYAWLNANCKDKFEGSVSEDTINSSQTPCNSVQWQRNKSLYFPVLILSRLLLKLKSFGFYGCFITSHQNCISGPSTYDTDQGFSPVKPLSQPHDFTVVTAPLPKGAGDKLCLTPSYSSDVS